MKKRSEESRCKFAVVRIDFNESETFEKATVGSVFLKPFKTKEKANEYAKGLQQSSSSNRSSCWVVINALEQGNVVEVVNSFPNKG